MALVKGKFTISKSSNEASAFSLSRWFEIALVNILAAQNYDRFGLDCLPHTRVPTRLEEYWPLLYEGPRFPFHQQPRR
jgi:hypothetical protein